MGSGRKGKGSGKGEKVEQKKGEKEKKRREKEKQRQKSSCGPAKTHTPYRPSQPPRGTRAGVRWHTSSHLRPTGFYFRVLFQIVARSWTKSLLRELSGQNQGSAKSISGGDVHCVPESHSTL